MDGVKLDPVKTEFIIGDIHTSESLVPKFTVSFVQNSISPAEKVKNLGVAYVSENSFDNDIAKVCLAIIIIQNICDAFVLILPFWWQTLWSVVN